tara:strand:+ start:713 stop:2212 length:1500 start_codon:yes stop_codon:yes gene_type:complete
MARSNSSISTTTSAPNYQRVARNANANEAAVVAQGGAYVILDQGDVVISNDSITAPMWSNNNPNLTQFFTSSTQISSNVQEYYTSVFQTASTEVSAEIQFDIAYGDQVGSGSQFLNNLVTGSTPTRTNYGQYRNLVLGDENASFIFGGVTSSYWYALPIERARYKQTILPGTWTLKIQGFNATTVTTAITTNLVPTAPLPTTYAATAGLAVVAANIKWFESDGITADSAFQTYFDALSGPAPTATIVVSATLGVTSLTFNRGIGTSTAGSTSPLKAGMVMKLDNAQSGITDDIFLRVSKYWMAGTSEIQLTDDSKINTTTQFCDAGRIFQIISGSAGVVNTSLGNVNGYTSLSGSYGFMLPDINTLILNGEALDSVPQGGGINFGTSRSFDSKGDNTLQLVDSLNNGGQFTINSQEDLSSDYIFCRAKNSEYNYSANPSFISSSTGAVAFPEFVENPTTYITTVGLYNISQELLAVAKLSRPLEKNFTKELLVRVKLDF